MSSFADYFYFSIGSKLSGDYNTLGSLKDAVNLDMKVRRVRVSPGALLHGSRLCTRQEDVPEGSSKMQIKN